jgi:hypothetical protein
MTHTQTAALALVLTIAAGLALAIYLLPWLIARHRDAEHTTAIGLLNLLLGWTAVGYIAALLWAITDNTKNNTRQLRTLSQRAKISGPFTTPNAARAKHEQPKRQPWQH